MATAALRLTKAELHRWQRAALKGGISLSEYVRGAVRAVLAQVKQRSGAGLSGVSFEARRSGRRRGGDRRPKSDCLLKIRLSSKEHAAWLRFAVLNGTSLSGLVRGCVEAARGTSYRPPDRQSTSTPLDKSALAELIRDEKRHKERPTPVEHKQALQFVALLVASKARDERERLNARATGRRWPPRRPKGHRGKVAAKIEEELYALRLERSGHHDLEPRANRDGPLSNFRQPGYSELASVESYAAQRFFELAARAAEDPAFFPNRKDRAIARAIATAVRVRSLKLQFACGQRRIDRICDAIRRYDDGV